MENHDVRAPCWTDRLSSEGIIDTGQGCAQRWSRGFSGNSCLVVETRFKAAFCINAIVDMVTAASPETAQSARYLIGRVRSKSDP
jgi:hypothetical protein